LKIILSAPNVDSILSNYNSPQQKQAQWIWDRIVDGADITGDFLAEKIGQGIVYLGHQTIELLNYYSSEIITTGIVFTSVGVMLAPMWGDNSGKWLGRTVAVFFLGTVWRIII